MGNKLYGEDASTGQLSPKSVASGVGMRMEKGKLPHPYQAGVNTLLACSWNWNQWGVTIYTDTLQDMDSSVCLSGCSTHCDGFMVSGSIAIAAY